MPTKKAKKTAAEPIYNQRHSLAHIMAQAVLEIFPEAKLAIGPPIDTGFYYDFELPRTLMPEDLPLIEEKMRRIIKEAHPFEQYFEPKAKALAFLREINQPYKVELAEELAEKELSFFRDGDFVDMCEGPHVAKTDKVGAFKLTSIAGAYWRGDEKRPMLQRIYAVAFPTQKEVDEYLLMMAEAKKRDHRKLGKELGIYMMSDEVGAGLPLWLPKGAAMIEEIEKLAKEVEFEAGYERVRTPHITKGTLYHKSGHLPYYAASMYAPMQVDEEEYYLKPMNCPHHHLIYANETRSYRDLPLRLAEYGHCYRYEDSGALFGLMRVRSMAMNDAHIYCTPEQFQDEFLAVLDIYKKYLAIFGIEKYFMRLSLHGKDGLGKKYVDDEELWLKTEAEVRQALKSAKIEFVEAQDEAAFYGPKIDVEIFSVIGREFTLATNQLDFAVPKRFGLTYMDKDNQEKTPLCIHRAPLSTHERLIGFLLEHFAGAFPTWLAPVQVRVIGVSEKSADYAQKVTKELKQAGRRVELDLANESVGKKIRSAEMMKIPYMLVVGEKEAKAQSVSVRSYFSGDQGVMKLAKFAEKLATEVTARQLPPKQA